MLPQALQLIPYVAVAAAILLGVAVGFICFSQGSRRITFGVSWRPSILSAFQKWYGALIGPRPARPDVIIHDPESSKPHDLDDPFFDPKVRARVGVVIASAARKK